MFTSVQLTSILLLLLRALLQAESSAAGREMQRRYYSPLAYALTKLVSVAVPASKRCP